MGNLFRQLTQQEIFEKIADHFVHPGILIFRGRELAQVSGYMREYPVDAQAKVLDLGCAEGYIGSMLFNKIDVGLDLGIRELKKAKEQPVYRSFVAADARDIPFKAGEFDIIFSNSVIEHIKGLERVLEGVSRVLADQGLFIFTVPSDKFAENLYFTTLFKIMNLAFLGRFYSRLRNRQLSHFNLFNDSQWSRHLGKFSLQMVYKKYYLSKDDIYLWDKVCFFLRITRPLAFVHRKLLRKYLALAQKLSLHEQVLDSGAGLLIVARKIRE